MDSPYLVVRQFESALCAYTGAPFCVTTTSCTSAILLAVAWYLRDDIATLQNPMQGGTAHWEKEAIEIPKRTYVGVAQSILNAGGRVTFRDEQWVGGYQLRPLPIFDEARWLRADMYESGLMMCASFHHTKHLAISTHGGAILHDDPAADAWLRKARFDGRTEGVAPKDDVIQVPAWHCYMTPPTAAEGLLRLASLPRYNEPLSWGPGTASDYPDLSQMECFR